MCIHEVSIDSVSGQRRPVVPKLHKGPFRAVNIILFIEDSRRDERYIYLVSNVFYFSVPAESFVLKEKQPLGNFLTLTYFMSKHVVLMAV